MSTESSVLTNQDDQLQNKSFNEQVFLIHYYEKFLKADIRFKNFIQILGEPGLLVNRLFASGLEEFFNIKPAQLSLLQPKIRLFKTVYENGQEQDIELVFNDFYRDPTTFDMLKNSGQRGFGVGLKSFEWEDLGTNPGDTGKAFQATLILHAQKLSDLFEKQLDPLLHKEISFIDLIRIQPNKFIVNNVYNNLYFRIKVQLGWQVPNENISLISKELYDAIKATTITLFLTLTDHTIDLKADGTAQITVNYIGAIEGKMLSPETDILYVGVDTEKNITNQQNLINYYQDRNSILKNRIDTASKNDMRGPVGKIFGGNGYIARATSIALDSIGFGSNAELGSNDQLELENNEKEIELRKIIKENIQKEDRAISYGRLLTELEKNNRIFYIDLDKHVVDSFLSLKNQNLSSSSGDPSQIEKEKAKVEMEWKLKNKTVTGEPQQYKATELGNPRSETYFRDTLKKTLESKDSDKDKSLQNEIINNRLTSAIEAKPADKTRINYIYFGDIIDTVLSIIKNKTVITKDPTVPKDDINRFKYIIGPIELIDSNQQTKIVNLADIPISIDLFNSWFLKKVIRPQLPKYLLRDFLRDICAELIIGAIAADPLSTSFSKAPNSRVSFSVFDLGTNKSDPMGSDGDKLNLNDIRLDPSQLASLRSNTDPSSMKHYFMIYISGLNPHQLHGQYNEDIKQGIYHLYFGADRGIVKNIQFKKVDMEYIKESRIVDQYKSKKGDIFFNQPYNASIPMWGVSVFKPGMNVYIDPQSVGMPPSILKNERIQIGGYYNIIKVFSKIEPGQFETTIDLNWVSNGDELENTKYSISEAQNKEKSIDAI